MKNPAAIWELFDWQIEESCFSEQMLMRLETDVQSCLDCDQVYSPGADAKCHQIGKGCLSHAVSCNLISKTLQCSVQFECVSMKIANSDRMPTMLEQC